MRISFCPQRRDDALNVSKSGDILTINNDDFDFSELPDGATVPTGEIPCEWIVGPVERVDGEIHLTLLLPHGPNPSEAMAFPETILNVPDGSVAVPFDVAEPLSTPEEEEVDVEA